MVSGDLATGCLNIICCIHISLYMQLSVNSHAACASLFTFHAIILSFHSAAIIVLLTHEVFS